MSRTDVIYALALALALAFAPAPRPRPVPPLALAGEWRRLSWCGDGGRAIFRRDGSCSYFYRDYRWDGEWELKGGTLKLWSWAAFEGPPEEPRADRWLYVLTVGKVSKGRLEGKVVSQTYGAVAGWTLEK